MKRLQVKVCGMREADNILRVEALQPDYMGFICWEGSRRYVAQSPAYLPTSCRRVGVFVRPEIGTVIERIRLLGLDAVQLHGGETPEFCRHIRQASLAEGQTVEIIKAFSIAPEQPFPSTKEYESVCDYFLFDTSCPTVGGSGQQFDWEILRQYEGHTPFFLSGGIGPDSLEALRRFSHPRWAGVDLNSRFELSPGVKDVEQLARLIHGLHEQNKV